MKTLIKWLLGVWVISIIGMAILFLLSLWHITPIPFPTAWKIVATIAGLILIVLLYYLCMKTFFQKSNNGDKNHGNKAHPVK